MFDFLGFSLIMIKIKHLNTENQQKLIKIKFLQEINY